MTRAWQPAGRPGEGGAASVMLMPFLAVLLLTTTVLAFQGGVLVAQRRVQAAADLAALAGATAAGRGADACRAATAVAARNRGRLAGCWVSGPAGREVLVQVTLQGPAILGRSLDLTARARAGPAGHLP